MAKRREQDKLLMSEEQQRTQRDCDMSCEILDHPVLMDGRERSLSQCRKNGLFLYPSLTLQSPAIVYESLFAYFHARYEPVPPDAASSSDSREFFYLKHMVETLRTKMDILYGQLQQACAKAVRKGSCLWMVEHLNHAISMHNGNLFDEVGAGAVPSFCDLRVPRIDESDSTIKHAREYRAYDKHTTAPATMLVGGWRTRLVAQAAHSSKSVDVDDYSRGEWLFLHNEIRTKAPLVAGD